MSGITMHVVRKATQVERPDKSGSGRFLRREGSSNNTLPLLSDSGSDSEMELYHTSSTRQGAQYTRNQENNEDIFMKDHVSGPLLETLTLKIYTKIILPTAPTQIRTTITLSTVLEMRIVLSPTTSLMLPRA